MFLFGKGVTDGVASELLGTNSRILDESGKPLSARAIVKALEQRGEPVPSRESHWETGGARLQTEIRLERTSTFMQARSGTLQRAPGAGLGGRRARRGLRR